MGEMKAQVYKTPVVHRGGFAPVGFGQSKTSENNKLTGPRSCEGHKKNQPDTTLIPYVLG